jgi:hypothetical protein
MRDAWIPVFGAGAASILALAGAIYLRSGKPVGQIEARWSQAAAILVGAAVVMIADRFGNLDWYFAIPLGSLAFLAIRFPAYVRQGKTMPDQNRRESSN